MLGRKGRVMRTRFFFAAILTLLAATAATAQDRTISLQKGEGPVAALWRAGCDQTWLSRVVADTPLDPAKFRSLPVGQPLKVAGDCTKPAPKHVASLSRYMMKSDLTAQELNNLRAEAAGLRGTAQSVAARAEAAEQRVGEFELRVGKLERELAAAQKAKSEAEKKLAEGGKSDFGTTLFVVAVGMVAGGVIGFVIGQSRLSPAVIEADKPEDPNLRIAKTVVVDRDGQSSEGYPTVVAADPDDNGADSFRPEREFLSEKKRGA